jgi:ubiquinone/menaquinone biosynthesis C-methylase UbiE
MSAPIREREDWFDRDFAANWLTRQEGRTNERQRQFAMVRALIPFRPEDSFSYLDVAAGDGALDELLLTKFPHAEATLLDGSPYMVERAQQRLKGFGARARYAQGDLADSGWMDQVQGPFDVALSTIALHNLEDPARTRTLYAEIARILADCGLFMNLDYVRAPHPSLGAVYRFASAGPESGFMQVRGYRAFLGTVEEHLGWLAEAGLSPVDCFWRELRLALFGGFKGAVRVPEPHG